MLIANSKVTFLNVRNALVFFLFGGYGYFVFAI